MSWHLRFVPGHKGALPYLLSQRERESRAGERGCQFDTKFARALRLRQSRCGWESKGEKVPLLMGMSNPCLRNRTDKPIKAGLKYAVTKTYLPEIRRTRAATRL